MVPKDCIEPTSKGQADKFNEFLNLSHIRVCFFQKATLIHTGGSMMILMMTIMIMCTVIITIKRQLVPPSQKSVFVCSSICSFSETNKKQE